MLICVTSYLCKTDHTMSELMKKTVKEVMGKKVTQKWYIIENTFLMKQEVSYHEAAKSELSLHMWSSNIATVFVPTGL